MNTKQLERRIAKTVQGKNRHGKGKLATGIAFGTIVGSAVVFSAAKLINNMVESGKMADAEAVLKRTGNRAHRIGDTAKYTIRSMSGRMMKGTESIKKDIGKGADDIRKTMHT